MDDNDRKLSELLTSGTKIDATGGEWGLTALHHAAAVGDSQAAKRLLDAQAVTSTKDWFGFTPLLRACFNGHAPVVETLLQARADPCQADDTGRLPLHVAAAQGHACTVSMLLECRVLVSPHADDGRTPLEMAEAKHHTQVVELLKEAERAPEVDVEIREVTREQSREHFAIVEPPVVVDPETREDRTACIICMERPRNTALVPCGHYFGCHGCTLRITACPICRGPVAARVRVFAA